MSDDEFQQLLANLKSLTLKDPRWEQFSLPQLDILDQKIKEAKIPMLGGKIGAMRKAKGFDIDKLKAVDSDNDPEFQLLRKNGEFSPEGWFLYFWREGKASLAEVAGPDRQALNNMTQTLFVKDGENIKLSLAVRKNQTAGADPDFAAWLARDQNNVRNFGQWMEILLKAGFRPYLADRDEVERQRSGPGANPTGELACADNVALAKEFLKTPFTWRADTRPLSAIASDSGFNTKADQTKGYSASHGLREAWNPFSKAEINKYYWFRKGSNDNCKYTVVSVGLEADWKKVVSFPRLCDLHGWPGDLFAKSSGKVQPFSALSVADQKKVSTWFDWGWMLPAQCMVDGKLSSQPVLLPAVRTYLFLLILGGVVINTNAIQGKGDSFPEVGVKRLSLRNIYGAVEVVRFHHGEDDGDGYTGFVVSSQKVTNQARTKRFQRTEKQLEASFNGIANHMGPMHLGWAASGFATVQAEYKMLGKKLLVVGFNKTAKPLQCSILWP
jgi:hypothetical protein